VELLKTFGPNLAYASGTSLDTGVGPEKLVTTHCCFCGQQCGMHLKVRDNKVIGIEPWYEFPFNKGKLCPKGVKRYLQNGHPDRLLHAYRGTIRIRADSRKMPYEEAIRRVAGEIDRIQSTYGNDAFGMLSGRA
jgi:assimilatory nitrate reductase catalytic subunit